jgi:glycosyltransferase involved in cell wall biosynthesis
MLRHYGHDSISERRRIISGCCSDHFQQVPVADRRDRPKIQFIGIGSLVRWKRWHLVLEALNLLGKKDRDKYQYSLYGPTLDSPESRDYTQNLHKMIHDYGLETTVKICGPTNRIEECLRSADWFLLPSINEPCSIALIEALSLGIPALTSSSGGNIDILQPGKTGLLFEPDNPEDLAAKMRAISEGGVSPIDPEMIRDSVRHRSASHVVQEYARLYQQLQTENVAPISSRLS